MASTPAGNQRNYVGKLKRRGSWVTAVLVILALTVLFDYRSLFGTCPFGEPFPRASLLPGDMQVPHSRRMKWRTHSTFADSIFNIWADKPILKQSINGKGDIPRILLAKLYKDRDIPEVNRILMNSRPWGVCGSSWALNPKGDYDFTITVYTTMLWLFGENSNLIYPETREHLLNILLTAEGNKFTYSAPRTLGLFGETENHMLMTEGSRYLKNRWMSMHGNKDPHFHNEKNGMEAKLLALLNEIRGAGLYEFNSNPYDAYTITALLNLEAFGSHTISNSARDVLDYINWDYALGSYGLKHYPPFRRLYGKASLTALTTDYQSCFMKAWLSYSGINRFDHRLDHGQVHFMMGACMPYRPPDEVVRTLFDKTNGYFVRLGHGRGASPEIYSAGKGFLISDGGVNRGTGSMIVARPTTLFLNDDAENLSQTFHIEGPGTSFMKWNDTGVYRNFACAAGPVHVPGNYKRTISDSTWSLYDVGDSLCVAVHSTKKFGMFVIFERPASRTLLLELESMNPESRKLEHRFSFPGGEELSYNVDAPKDRWVMESVNGKELSRYFDKWPLIQGSFSHGLQITAGTN